MEKPRAQGGKMDGFEQQVAQHESQIEGRISVMRHLKVQQKYRRGANDKILGAIIPVNQNFSDIQHPLGFVADNFGQIRVGLGGGPMVRVDAQLWIDAKLPLPLRQYSFSLDGRRLG